jgi:hypothetical protein
MDRNACLKAVFLFVKKRDDLPRQAWDKDERSGHKTGFLQGRSWDDPLLQVREEPIQFPLHETRRFAKTGSGQTSERKENSPKGVCVGRFWI